MRESETTAGKDESIRDLLSVWKLVESEERTGYTSIVVPSLSLDVDELKKIRGASGYEERLLFTLIRLRDPRARVVYLTSQPLHPEIIEYYLDLLHGVSTRDARERLTLLPLYDSSAAPLTAKVLERPRVVARLRDLAARTTHSYLTCFNSSELEARLAREIGVPLNGVAPELLDLGTKSGSRKVFAAAGLDMPRGFEDIRSREQVIEALSNLRDAEPDIRKAVVKLDESFAGAGNAVFRYPPAEGSIEEALGRLECASAEETHEHFLAKLDDKSGIVEEFMEASEVRSPSAQLRIGPAGDIDLISTHEQILGGSTGQTYLGCRFPADPAYRRRLGELGYKVGEVLRDRGVVSRFGVDFLAFRGADGEWKLPAIEINLRMGGTTGPFLALQFLTSGAVDPSTGLYRSATGIEKFYVATDNLSSPSYRGLLTEDFMDILAGSRVGFDPASETGAVFHMIGSLSQFGKMGVTAIGDSREQADEIYHQVIEVFDRAGEPDPGIAPDSMHPFDLAIRSIE